MKTKEKVILLVEDQLDVMSMHTYILKNNATPENADSGLAKLVLTLIE
jgi:hypothetical protein